MMIAHKHISRSRRISNGFSMLEVLIATVVLSVGLLGIAGLQLMSLKMNDSAYFRSQAVILAEDILDRMRSDRSSVIAGAYDYDPNPKKGGNHMDIKQWSALLSTKLPGGKGMVERNNGIVTVTVQWNDSRGEWNGSPGGGGEEMRFIVSAEL